MTSRNILSYFSVKGISSSNSQSKRKLDDFLQTSQSNSNENNQNIQKEQQAEQPIERPVEQLKRLKRNSEVQVTPNKIDINDEQFIYNNDKAQNIRSASKSPMQVEKAPIQSQQSNKKSVIKTRAQRKLQVDEEDKEDEVDEFKNDFSDFILDDDEEEYNEKQKTKNRSSRVSRGNNDKKLSQSTTPIKKNVNKENIEPREINFNKEEIGETLPEFEDKVPVWALPENRKDSRGRKMDHPEYDPTTLLIPKESLNQLTPAMIQYWQIKQQNFDTIMLFKLGKFYEIFYDDAVICHKLLDLNWMGKKMHVGFPERAINKYASILVQNGYKVAIVEQTETPRELDKRIKSAHRKLAKEEKVVQREMVQVYTKGTYRDPNDQDPDPKYILSLYQSNEIFGICFCEVSTDDIYIGAFQDDEYFSLLKTILYSIKPQEVIYHQDHIHKSVIQMLKTSHLQPLLSNLSGQENWNVAMTKNRLDQLYGNEQSWPIIIQEINQDQYLTQDLQDICFQSIGGLVNYFRQIQLLEVIKTAKIKKYDPYKFYSNHMVLDAQCLQHLEILEVQHYQKNPYEGSLMYFLDKTSTPYGKRMFRKWITGPPLDINVINQRLDAIEDLEVISDIRDQFRNDIRKLPDLERQISKIFKYSIKTNDKVVYFEDIPVIRLREFREILKNLDKAETIVLQFQNVRNKFKSKRLKALTGLMKMNNNHIQEQQQDIEWEYNDNSSSNSVQGMIPNISQIIEEMNQYIIWEGSNRDIPTPKPGVEETYDQIKEEIENIKIVFDGYLKKVKQQFKNDHRITYAHAKFRYEIEIPEELVKGQKKPQDLEFTSQRSGFQRFHIKAIKNQIEILEEAEGRLKSSLYVFIRFLFKHFQNHYKIWDRFIQCVSEIDCLCSLSVISFNSTDQMCRPELYELDNEAGPFLEVLEMRHPCITNAGINFVPNNIIIGNHQQQIVLTGPNMGGKSTILRQACLAAIISQLGCYVPAKSCKLSIVDRVFTRIGASDKLMEGKSTFFIEMEETGNIVKLATQNSLAIIDELGRGTSTFDGVAIAYSVLKYLVEKVKCRTLFATHYHILVEDFRLYQEIGFYHMACHIDTTKDKLIFLYKLIEGVCESSFGLNVARIAGLSLDIVKRAKTKSEEFEKDLKFKEMQAVNKMFNNIIAELEDIQ